MARDAGGSAHIAALPRQITHQAVYDPPGSDWRLQVRAPARNGRQFAFRRPTGGWQVPEMDSPRRVLGLVHGVQRGRLFLGWDRGASAVGNEQQGQVHPPVSTMTMPVLSVAANIAIILQLTDGRKWDNIGINVPPLCPAAGDGGCVCNARVAGVGGRRLMQPDQHGLSVLQLSLVRNSLCSLLHVPPCHILTLRCHLRA